MIDIKTYAARRASLMQFVDENSLIIIPSAKELIRNGDAAYMFRQNSDFYYLTGINESDCVLVLAPGRKEGECVLFNRPCDLQKQKWEGPRLGQVNAVSHFLFDEAYPIASLNSMLSDLLLDRTKIFYPFNIKDSAFTNTIFSAERKARKRVRGTYHSSTSMIDIDPQLNAMRVIKSANEIELIQKAIDITGRAHKRAMQFCKPGMYEYELEAELMHEFISHGSRAVAYSSIVGSGENTCVLHYTANNKIIQNNDLVLIDAGCEFENYASDITRTFPANGKFSGEQREIYNVVLNAQMKIIEAIKPGIGWDALNDLAVKNLTQGLIDVGILQGNLNTLIETQAYFPYYMHGFGHWLGLDVHDVGYYRDHEGARKLEPGMVFTVEPGLYLSPDKNLDKRWHHIGVRIEDNIVVTETGCRVMSEAIPKTVADIEQLMSHS